MNESGYKFRLDGYGKHAEGYYTSSNIERIHWTPVGQLPLKVRDKYPRGRLIVSFQNGGVYTYNVGEEAYRDLERRAREGYTGDSTGKYYNSGRFVQEHVDPRDISDGDGAYVDRHV